MEKGVNLKILGSLCLLLTLFSLSACQTGVSKKSSKFNNLKKYEAFRWTPSEFANPPQKDLKRQQLSYKSPKGAVLTHALFGYFDEKDGGKLEFVATKKIPYKVGLSYGWFFKVEGETKKQSDLTEEFQLPEPPRILRFNLETTKVSNDGTRIVTTLPFKETNGWIQNSWMITPEDPKGPYSITILDGDKPIHTFEFELTN